MAEGKSPQQIIFDAIFAVCLKINERTYDYLPDANTEYPFIYVGELFNIDVKRYKLRRSGDVSITVHVYGGRRDRLKVTQTLEFIEADVKALEAPIKTATYNDSSTQVLNQKVEAETLIHGIIEINMSY